jgi:hypothetical protein
MTHRDIPARVLRSRRDLWRTAFAKDPEFVFALYYNEMRTHLGLGKDAPLRRHIEQSGTIVTTPILVRVASSLRADKIFWRDNHFGAAKRPLRCPDNRTFATNARELPGPHNAAHLYLRSEQTSSDHLFPSERCLAFPWVSHSSDGKRVLADIDADHGDCRIELVWHSVLLVFGTPCRLPLLAGREHGRTIPLAVIGRIEIPQCSRRLPGARLR